MLLLKIGHPMVQAHSGSITITRCEYVVNHEQLHIEAISNCAGNKLEVFLTSAEEHIGSLYEAGPGRYSVKLAWRTIPQNITVTSSLGCIARAAVILK